MESSDPAFTTGYKPTSLEQAYSLYILDVVLQVPREPFRLSGRVAVPFLNSSGVDRRLLREMWNVVDPTMEGSLLDVIQFTSLLKLVSLAQQKCLDMTQYEGQLLYRQVPLPTFLHLIVMPSHQLLLELYPSVAATQLILNAPMEHLSVSDAFGDLALDAPLPALLPPSLAPLPDDDEDDFGDLQGVDGPTEHVDEDFGDFQREVQSDPSQELMNAQEHDDNDFGDFTAPPQVAVHPSLEVTLPEEKSPLEASDRKDDNTGDLNDRTQWGTTSIEPAGSGGKHHLEPSSVVNLGGLSDATARSTLHTENQSGFEPPHSMLSTSPALSNENVGELVEIPTPIIGTAVPAPMQERLPDGFNDIPDGTDRIASAIDDSSFDAFGAIHPIENQPLPSLDAFAAPPVVSAALDDDNVGDYSGISHTMEDAATTIESAFDAIQPIEDQPLPSLHAMVAPAVAVDQHGDEDADDFGDFTSIPHASEETTATIDSAFDAIQPNENHPLPSLHAMLVPPGAVDQHGDGDDFGDFTSSPHAMEEIETTVDSAFQAIQPIKNQPLSSLHATVVPPVAVDQHGDDNDFCDFTGIPHASEENTTNSESVFVAFQPVEERELPSLHDMVASPDAVDHIDDDDDFGDFIGIPHASEETGTNIDSAFDAIQTIEDQPLPSLHTMVAPPVAVDQRGDDDADDFGDFSGIPHASEETAAPIESAFDAIQPIEDQPLPSLHTMILIPGAVHHHDDEDDDFGDFTGIDHISEETTATSDGRYDAIQPIEDQTLPSHEAVVVSRVPVDGHGDDDDFGNFTGVPHLPEETAKTNGSAFEPVADHPLPSTHAMVVPPFAVDENCDDDDLGDFSQIPCGTEHMTTTIDCAFDEIQPIENDPLPSLDATTVPSIALDHHDNNDAFGSFIGIIHVNDETSETVEGAFDEIQPIENKPLSSLLAASTFAGDHHHDGFDDFGDFTGISPTPEQMTATMDVAFESIRPSGHQPLPIGTGVDSDPFGLFNSLDGSFPDRPLVNLTSHSDLSPHEPPLQDEPTDDSFGDFIAPAETAPSHSDIEPSFEADAPSMECPERVRTMNQGDNNDVGNVEAVETSTSIKESSANPTAPLDLFNVLTPLSSSKEAQGRADDDDWGDFEHVQMPNVAGDHNHEDSSAFVVASANDFETVSKPSSLKFATFADSDLDGRPTTGASTVVDFNADFAAFAENHLTTPSTTAVNAEEDLGQWDSFQDARPKNDPLTLDEIQRRLQQISLEGSFTKIDLVKQMKKSLISKSWTSTFAGNSNMSLQRAKRCLDVVSLLATSCSNLSCGDWNRVFCVVRDEMSLGLFLLLEAKKMPKASEKDVEKPLLVMVAGLCECVRVVRSIMATIGDMLCLDVYVSLSKEVLTSSWQSLGIAQLACEVEECWKSIETAAKSLKTWTPSKLETIETIRKCALESKSSSLCQLTLQPVFHEESTKNEVIWEGKPFMACAANLWSNRVSSSFPYSS